MVLFCRTGTLEERQLGTSQFLVDMRTPGIEVRPIFAMSGEHHFNEVVFRDVFLPEAAVIGAVGEGWKQVTAELVNERSGPERFLSSFVLFHQMVEELGANASPSDASEIGRIAAHIAILRRLSRSVAGMLQSGSDPSLQAAVVKDLGAVLEEEIPELARRLIDVEPSLMAVAEFPAVIAHTMLHARHSRFVVARAIFAELLRVVWDFVERSCRVGSSCSSVDGAVATITLNLPASRNPISDDRTIERCLLCSIESIGSTTVRVAILTGAGSAFSAGGDLRQMSTPGGLGTGEPVSTFTAYAQAFNGFRLRSRRSTFRSSQR